MNVNNIVNKLALLSVCLLFSQILSAQEDSNVGSNIENALDSLIKEDTKINLVFKETSHKRSTGSMIYIDVESELLRDSRSDISSLINGKASGVFNSYNLWGTGNAVVIVDGIRQDPYVYERLNPLELESIVILKDAVSKALYGAQGDQGVILINTKKGRAGPQKIRVSAQYSISEPRSLPNYLNAAEYMEKFNEAQINDGVNTLFLKFNQRQIDSTRSGSNSVLYPDNDFYTDEYLCDYTTNFNVFADVIGGDENARYYVSSEWGQSEGWLNTTIPDITNRINFRGNLDFKINEYIRMSVDASARLNLSNEPNLNLGADEDYWNRFASILPNAYPVLWDPSLIVDEATRELLLKEAKLIDGEVLGGSSSYANNQIFGDLTQNGMIRDQQRNVQFGGKLAVDLGFITKGLTAKGYAGMNFYNSLYTQQNYEYAIYEPVFNELTELIDTVIRHGVDRPSNRFVTNSANSSSFRQISYYGNLGYDRNFNNHDVSATALVYGDQITYNGQLQKNVLFHTGLTINYMYNKRYVAEASAIGIGTRKLAEGDRMELAPTFGLAWIISEENFMDNLLFVNFIKLRASYGISKNDNWDHYFLYKNIFSIGSGFNYYNGTHANNQTLYESVENDIHLQKREDISFGVDAGLFNNRLKFDLGYFISSSLDNITQMVSTYPQYMGFEDLAFLNYNSDKTEGIELGLNYNVIASNNFSATLGGNLLHISPLILKYDEPNYTGADAGLLREGTATDAMWALVADGLYAETDFNEDGTLANDLPVPTFGTVQPGDIKYLDQNGDGFIDQLDQRMVGHDTRTQFSAYLDIRFKNIGFYLLGIGRFGDSNYRTGSYFRVYGDIKYSEYALQAYGPDNKNTNALHPRLSTNSGGHNDRNSSYWLYQNNSFTLPTMQLTYHFKGQNRFSFLNSSRAYIRGSNLLVLSETKEYTEVNPTSAPKLRSIVVGLVTSF